MTGSTTTAQKREVLEAQTEKSSQGHLAVHHPRVFPPFFTTELPIPVLRLFGVYLVARSTMGNAPSSNNAHTARFLAGCPEIPPTPVEHDVLEHFGALLRAKAIVPTAAEELRRMETLDTKWMYIFLMVLNPTCVPCPRHRRSKLGPESVDKDWLDPCECVQQVRNVQQHNECVQDLFRAIRINIVLRPREWVDKFIAADGVGALVALLNSTTKTYPVVYDEVLNVFFALTSFSEGLAAMTEGNDCCAPLLFVCERSSSPVLQTRILKLLNLLCRHSASAQASLLNAISGASTAEERPFRSLSHQFIGNPHDPVLQTAVVAFLNTLMASISDAAYRIAIREDLQHHGFLAALQDYEKRSSETEEQRTPEAPALKAEIHTFLTNHNDDLSTQGDERSSTAASSSEVNTERESSTWDFTITDASPAAGPVEAKEQEREKESIVESDQSSCLPAPEKSEIDLASTAPTVERAASSSGSNQLEGDSRGDAAVADSPSADSIPMERPRTTVQEASNQPREGTLLQSLVAQLECQQLDDITSQKIARVLQALVQSLSDEKVKGVEVVDRLEKTLRMQPNASQDEHSTASPAESSPEDAEPVDALKRVRLRLLSGFSDALGSSAAGSPGKPSAARPSSPQASLFQSFENFFSGSSAPTPAKPSAHSEDCLTASEPSGIAGSPVHESAESGKAALPKLTLPFFQSFRKGPGLGATPASTPIATASVRKDAKRHSFSAFAPSPMPKELSSGGALPSLSLTPVVPALVRTPPSLTVDVPTRLDEAIQGASTESSGPAPPTSTDVSKFRKLLSMGAPKEAVRAKMRQAGLDPDQLDEKQGFDVSSSIPPVTIPPATAVETVAETTAPSTASSGPDISKFRKLLSMGAPLPAVKAKMMQAGLDPALLDQKVGFTEPSASPATPEVAAAASATTSEETPQGPDISKFKKLLSMGAPLPAVKAKMVQAGLDPALLDGPLPTPSRVAAAPKVLVKDDPEYAKFFKLQSMGAPAAAVKAKMRQAGLNCDLLDTPDAEMPGKGASPAPATTAPQKPQVLVKDDPAYAKFFKLLSMGAPAPTVKAKMQMAGLKPELLDTPDAPLAGPEEAEQQSKPQVLVKDDPEYAKFFKLLGMGAPAETVKMKMQMAGLRPELLDTPDAALTPASGGNQPAASDANAKPNAARRAHLAISIKPPAKQTTRSFYWQQLRGDVIKGTIWEEIEKENNGQNNQLPLVLSEGELAVLETEFPPPQAANGPGTGTQPRRNSVDHTSKEPGSPLASPRVVFLIDRGRANNISIIIKQFRMSHAALREAIMKLDANVLTIERVQGLLKIMPTEEEIAAITGFQGDPLTLNEAERILKELISVPRLKQRLAALQSKLQFPTLVRDLQTKVVKLRTASTEISQSAEFKTILLVVLQVGNKMNHGTNRGDAKGFRLGDLTKLAQLKSIDKSVTLLHFVARMIRLKKGNLVRLGDALASLYDVQNIPIPELQGDMAKITEVTDYIGNELSAQKLKNSIEEKEDCDLFVNVMSEFMDSASSTTAALKDELDATMQLLKDTMKRFDKDGDEEESAPASSGPPSAASMAGACEFFSTVYEFSVALMKADRENELKRLKEERQQKLQQQKSHLPTRSLSSVDLLSGLSGRSKSMHGEVKKVDEIAGPETPEAPMSRNGSRIPGRASSFGTSPVARSASMSAILESKSSDSTSQSSASANPAEKAVKSPERAGATEVGEKSKLKKPATGDSAKSPTRPGQSVTAASGKRDDVSSQAKSKAQKEKDKAKENPKEKEKSKFKAKAMMTVPGKIIKATKQAATISPLKITPATINGTSGGNEENLLSSLKKMANSSIEKGKRRAASGERIVPFDGTSSLDEIRNQLSRKHSSPGTGVPESSRSRRRSSGKPETESECEDVCGNNSTPPSPEKDISEAETSSSVSLVEAVLFATAAVTLHDITGGEVAQPSAELRRRLTAISSISALSSFRAVEKKGLRGFLEGGTLLNSSPDACANQCAADSLCLSFDFETVTLTCYISHSDRYAHPEAFLDFPTGVYYEWQGLVATPELEPNGGLYSTQIPVRLFSQKLGASIYYRVESLEVAATLTTATASSLFASKQTYGIAQSGDAIILPPYSCKIFAIAVKEGMTDSALLVSSEYNIYASKYAFLVPYFNGVFHGHVVRLRLDVKGKKRPRPARFLEFSDYESSMGIGPYSDQVSVVNLTTVNADFKGFYGGFTAFAPTAYVNETYQVPAADDANYLETKWRLVFEPQYTPHASHLGFGTPAREVQDSEYLYLAPFFNGANYSGTVIRILASTFSETPFIQQLNLTNISPDLKGFGSSCTDYKYAYFVPRENESGLFGKMVRIAMDDFSATGVTVLDLAKINPDYVGFSSAFTYNSYAYLVPFLRPLSLEEKTTNMREFPASNSGLLVRVNLQTFQSADALDLATYHPELVGFSAAVRVTNFAYFVPYMRRRVPSPSELNPYSALVARVDLRDFRSVAYLNLSEVDSELRGFIRGFAYKQFVIFSPSRSKFYSPGTTAQSGKVARLDTGKFDKEGVSFLDLAAAYRSQVPNLPDDSLRGFSGGFVSGKYGFFVPFFDGATFSGKICRINLDKFDEVQVLDLTLLDEDLRGFSGGIVSRTEETLETDLFGEFQMRQGTTTPYEYIY